MDIKNISKALLKELRKDPGKFNLRLKEFGRSVNIDDYSDEEVQNMYFGAYKDTEIILTDEGQFIDLKDVKQTICVLDTVTGSLIIHDEIDFLEVINRNIDNVRSFIIKDYQIRTNEDKVYSITNFLAKTKVLRSAGADYPNLYKLENRYRALQGFRKGYFPKDLFHPIKRNINDLFFEDDYYIKDFIVIPSKKASVARLKKYAPNK